MPRNILTPLLFVLAIILLLEFSLRLYIYKLDAFSFTKMNSYGLLMDSDLVQRAANTDVYYELKPDLDTYFGGKKFLTNSRGLADDEYSLAKPDDTYRVVVAGSSWTMATRVELPDAYHSVLERKLSTYLAPQKAEFINLGVENYGLGEIVASVRDKGLAYDPDMIIFAVTSITPAFLWEDEKPPFEQPSTVPAFWQSYLFSSAMDLLGKKSYSRTIRPQVKQGRGAYMTQGWRSLQELDELIKGRDIDVVVLVLTNKGFNEAMIKGSAYYSSVHGFRFIHTHIDDIAKDKGIEAEQLQVGRLDSHPNKTGHRLIAEKVFNEIWAEDSGAD
jgi:hypothetical protein